jgi:hypothetical protein
MIVRNASKKKIEKALNVAKKIIIFSLNLNPPVVENITLPKRNLVGLIFPILFDLFDVTLDNITYQVDSGVFLILDNNIIIRQPMMVLTH